jgi:hypothetical protein
MVDADEIEQKFRTDKAIQERIEKVETVLAQK